MRNPFRSRPIEVGAPAPNGDPVAIVDYRGRRGDIGAKQARSIMAFYTATQQGSAIMPGVIKWGERASSTQAGGARYSGDLGPLQQYMTTAPGWVGNSDKIRPGFSQGLPGTSTVPGQPPGDMLALLIATTPRQR